MELIHLICIIALFVIIGIALIRAGIKDEKTGLGILGVFFLVWSLAMLLFTLTKNVSALAKSLFGGFGLILIAAEASMLSNIFKCKERISGKYVGYERTPGGRHRYVTPIFEYEYNGISYSEKSRAFYGRLHIKRQLTVGKEYEIYVNPKNPKEFILYRRLKFGDVMLHLFALLLIILAFGALVSPETISFNIEL